MIENLVSIIVPVYNVKDYLISCVESLLCQTYTNIEILLIDDGSNDGSEKLCDMLSSRDKRVRTFHKSNGGLSDARNFGMQVFTGQFFTFVDSDDLIAKDMIEKLLEMYDKTHAEIVTCRCTRLCSGGISNHILDYEGVISTEQMLLWTFKGIISHSACGKLFSNEIASTLSFPIGKYYEDQFAIYDLILRHSNAIVNDTEYIYRKREGSITQAGKLSKKTQDLFDALQHVENVIKKDYPEFLGLLDYKILQDSLEIIKNDIKGHYTSEITYICRKKVRGLSYCNLKRCGLSKSYLTQYLLISHAYGLFRMIFKIMLLLKLNNEA